MLNRKLYETKQRQYVETAAEEARMTSELQQQLSIDKQSPKQKSGKAKASVVAGLPQVEDIVPKQSPYFKGVHTLSSISKAICISSAILNREQLFIRISQLTKQKKVIIYN